MEMEQTNVLLSVIKMKVSIVGKKFLDRRIHNV